MLSTTQEWYQRTMVYIGWQPRELDERRFEEILETLTKGSKIVGKDTSIEDYLHSLTPTSINKEFKGKDLLSILIEFGKKDLIPIILEKNPEILEKHMKLAEARNRDIHEMLKEKKDLFLHQASAALTPMFVIAKHKLWADFLTCLYTSQELIAPYVNVGINGETLFNLSCDSGQLEVSTKLMEIGAQCNVLSSAKRRFPLHSSILSTTGEHGDEKFDEKIRLIEMVYDRFPRALVQQDSEGHKPLQLASESFQKTELFNRMRVMESQLTY